MKEESTAEMAGGGRWDTRTPPTTARKLSYGFGAFGIASTTALIGQLLMYYYTDVYGLTPAQAGTVIVAASLWDAIVDPIVAWLASQTNTRFGRYRPFLIFLAAPVSLSFVLMFMRPDWSLAHLLMFAAVTHLLFRTLYQGVYLPYTALLAQLSTSATERSTIGSYKALFTTLGQLAVAYLGLTLVQTFGADDPQHGFLMCSIVMAAISALCILQAGLIARETDTAGEHPVVDVANPLAALAKMINNRQFILVCSACLMFNVGTQMITGGLVYLMRYELDQPQDTRLVLSALFTAAVLATPLWGWVARRHDKRSAWIGGSLIAGVMLIVALLVHPQTTPALMAVFFVYGVGLQALYVVMFASTADAVDYGEWLTGERTEALCFGIQTCFVKAGLAGSAGALGLLLSVIGFQPNQVQSPETLAGLRLGLFAVPAVLWFGTALLMSFYTISNKRHAEIRTELESRQRHVA